MPRPHLRLVLTGAALIAVSYGLARFALGLFVPELRAAFDLSATAVGAIMAASFVGYVIGLLAAGPVVARWGARSGAITAGTLATTGMAGIAAAPRPLLLAVAAAVGGASTGMASPALATAVEERIVPGLRPGAQTVVNAGTSLGLVAAVPVAMLGAGAWRLPWAAFAVAGLVATLAVVRAIPPGARHDGPGSSAAGLVAVDRRLAVSAVLLGLGSAAFWGFARELLEAAAGLSPTSSRLAWVAAGTVGVAGAFAGQLARRHGLPATVAVTGATLAASLAMLAVAPGTVALALTASGAFGAAYMAMTGLLIVWSVRDRPGAPTPAVATAFLLLAGGQIAGSPLAGAVADRAGLPAAFAVAALLAAGTAIVLPQTDAHAALAARSSIPPMTAPHAPCKETP